MNCLYARANSKFHLVLSDDKCPDFFADVDVSDIKSIEYSTTGSLEEDEWYHIVLGKPDHTNPDTISDPLERLHRQTQTGLDVILQDDYKNIIYFVYRKSGSDWLIVEKVYSASKFSKKFISFSEQPEIFNKPLIILNERPDALYNTNTNTLYFKKLIGLETIFNNINSLFKEATESEITEFLKLDSLSVHQDFDLSKVSITTSKLLASALLTYESHSDDTKEELLRYLDDLKLPKDKDNKFIIKDDKDLRNYIYALQERYFKTKATKEERLAKSYVKN